MLFLFLLFGGFILRAYFEELLSKRYKPLFKSEILTLAFNNL